MSAAPPRKTAVRKKSANSARQTMLASVFSRLRAATPTPTTELEYGSNFQLLIAVILSAQTTDRAVNLATRPLFARAPTPEALLALGEAGLADAIKTIGLYKTKARNVIATCRQLIEQHQAEVPHSREALEALPGVGRKTANVVLNTAFGEPTMAVDTHIFRLAHRLGASRGKTPQAVEQDLLATIPAEYLKDAHHWLILHGRYVCKARKPECWRCLIQDLCPYIDKSLEKSATTGERVPLEFSAPQDKISPAPSTRGKSSRAPSIKDKP